MAYVRLIEIVLHRFGNPDDATVAAIIAKLDPAYPADNFELNWLLTETLAYLQAPSVAAKGMALIAAAESQEPQIEYARSLRFLKAGWTPELRKQQLEFFLKAANYKGGSSFDHLHRFHPQRLPRHLHTRRKRAVRRTHREEARGESRHRKRRRDVRRPHADDVDARRTQRRRARPA
jgi:hypothetical protein